MSDATNIAWTNATWNPWMGCTKVSPGCDNCYMFREQRHYGHDREGEIEHLRALLADLRRDDRGAA